MGGSGPVLGVRNATRQLATLRSGRAGRRLNLTSTTGTGVPIYWLNGNKIADNYADFYDGGWDDETNPRNEAGELISGSAGLIWTGCNHDGTAKSGLTLGDSGGIATFGELNHGSHGPLSSDAIGGTSAQGRLYAISRIYTVREAGIATASIVSTPRHAARGYLAGEEIRVRLGFNEPVNVTEANQPPSVWLKVDNEVRRAWYVSGSGTANLEFAYTVQRGDSDSNGVGLCSDTALEDTCGRIAFNGGTVHRGGLRSEPSRSTLRPPAPTLNRHEAVVWRTTRVEDVPAPRVFTREGRETGEARSDVRTDWRDHPPTLRRHRHQARERNGPTG